MTRPHPASNWLLPGTPVLIDIRHQIATPVSGSQPLWFRRYAWEIRRFPRLALRNNRAMLLWESSRTACPPAYRSAIYSKGLTATAALSRAKTSR